MNKNILEKTNIIRNALEDKKAIDIRCLNVSEISSFTDVIVICSGSNINQLKALADSCEEALHKNHFVLKQIEGYDKANWILMDAGDIIINIFDKEAREYYDLEHNWIDAERV